jgi:hypothetical protein
MTYDNYNLFQATDEYITRPRFYTERERRFYPSEASVQVTDEHGDLITHGNCLRASYLRCSGDFEGVPYDARAQYIFAQGKMIEEALIRWWKEMGIWVANNVKFLDEENNISGELDVILAEPPDGQMYIGEVKSFYGYHAEKELFGSKYKAGFPKTSQLLQLLVYLNHFEDRLPYGRMIYFARDSVKRRTFKVELEHEGSVTYPKVEGKVVRQFSVEDIINRYKLLQIHLDSDTVPPKDFELVYPDSKIEDFYQKGKIGKTKYQKWEKAKTTGSKLKRADQIGDWQCSYCKFREVCWGSNPQ